MSATLLVAAAALIVQAAPPVNSESEAVRIDVAYDQLAQGRNDDAVARIRARHGRASDQPAALINLGTAYARMGQTDKASECYRAALRSRNPYDLELADGRWMDSRRVARHAIAKLERGEVLALR